MINISRSIESSSSLRQMNRRVHCLLSGMVLMLCILTILEPGTLHARQTNPINVTGGLSMSARAYQVSGIDGRRAPLSANTSGNLQFNFFGLRSGLNLTYTTEQSRLRQSVNRLSFDTGWSWGRVSAGDVSPDLGRFAMQGSTVRGGYVEANRYNVIAAFTAGQSRKAVNFSENSPFRPVSYQRMLYAGRIGYGDLRSDYITIGGMYGRDVAGSLDFNETTSPADNLVLTADGKIQLYARQIHLSGQISASALNRDIRNARSASSPIPGFMQGMIEPRDGSSFNLAGEGELRYQTQGFGVVTRYSRIQPGYESLGMEQIMNDQENLGIQPSFQLFSQRLMIGLNYQYGRNNLNNQLQSTLSRNQAGINITGRVSDALMITGAYNRMGNLNKPESGFPDPASLQLDFLMQTIMFTPVVMIQAGSYTHSVSLAGTWQFSNDRSLAVRQGIRPGRDQDVYMTALTWMVRFPSGFSINTSGNFVESDAGSATNTSYGLNAGTGLNLLENRLNLNMNMGWSANNSEFSLAGTTSSRSTEQLTGTVGASYRLSTKINLRFQSRGLVNRQKEGAGQAFSELQSEIFISYQF